MQDILEIGLKLLIGFICLLIFLNVTGKTQLSQMSPVDLIGNLVLGAIIGGIIYNPDIRIPQFLIVILLWSAMMTVARFLKMRNLDVRRIVAGEVIPLVVNRKFIVKNFNQTNLDISDFTTMLRMRGIFSLRDLKYAQLEPSGQLTVIKSDGADLPVVVISNGQVITDNLKFIDKDEQWLTDLLKEKNISRNDIFGAEWSERGLFVVPKNHET
ncbi:DUF421 domain-containing protein [Sporolactobacillus sp. THM19-2]|uniref:DUF421 domain-containing protein n=1 Tax=Sporolactobacillus sp. THM19-2 TaxID=2511171 RepID=UPI00101EB4F0|nr:DUF421 domain-containing protein [Sporolactobacillus sp. THM19-2]RYL89256.1 DUF421 domain-containing protein [Sporolactobacillus sp. THM19-2]